MWLTNGTGERTWKRIRGVENNRSGIKEPAKELLDLGEENPIIKITVGRARMGNGFDLRQSRLVVVVDKRKRERTWKRKRGVENNRSGIRELAKALLDLREENLRRSRAA